MQTHAHHEQEEDLNLVEVWLKKNPARWIAGAMAGIFAGAVSLIFAMLLAVILGGEFWYPAKLPAVPFFGGEATAYGFHILPILVGVGVHLAISAVLGTIFSHFVFTNARWPLIGMGVVWGIFSWIFIYNLFVQSFKMVFALQISPGAGFFVNLVFGMSLASLAFFDRMTHRT